MKIYIIGSAGSGKTTLSKIVNNIISIEVVNLDDIFWDNTSESFGNKRNEKERDSIFNHKLKEENWIIEGAYLYWPSKAFTEAHQLVFLDLNLYKVTFRIIKRFILRKINLEESNKKETIHQLIKLIRWNINQVKIMKEYFQNNKILYPHLITLRNKRDIKKYLSKLRANI